MRYKTWWQVWEGKVLEKEYEDEEAAWHRRRSILVNRPTAIVRVVGVEREVRD